MEESFTEEATSRTWVTAFADLWTILRVSTFKLLTFFPDTEKHLHRMNEGFKAKTFKS